MDDSNGRTLLHPPDGLPRVSFHEHAVPDFRVCEEPVEPFSLLFGLQRTRKAQVRGQAEPLHHPMHPLIQPTIPELQGSELSRNRRNWISHAYPTFVGPKRDQKMCGILRRARARDREALNSRTGPSPL